MHLLPPQVLLPGIASCDQGCVGSAFRELRQAVSTDKGFRECFQGGGTQPRKVWMGPGKRNAGHQSMHRSLGPGDRPQTAGKREVKGYMGKGREGEKRPQKRRRAPKTTLASFPSVNSVFPEPQAFGRNFYPPSFWLPPHLAFQQKLKSGAKMQSSLSGTGIAKSEASSKNLKWCSDLLKKITGVPSKPM